MNGAISLNDESFATAEELRSARIEAGNILEERTEASGSEAVHSETGLSHASSQDLNISRP